MSDIWTTKEGQGIPVDEMTDEHVLNTHRLLREACECLSDHVSDAWTFAAGRRGEMATYYADAYADEVLNNLTYAQLWRQRFAEELRKRKLKALSRRKVGERTVDDRVRSRLEQFRERRAAARGIR